MPTVRARRSRARLVGALLAIVLALALLAAALGAWYILFRPPGPAPLDPGVVVFPSGLTMPSLQP